MSTIHSSLQFETFKPQNKLNPYVHRYLHGYTNSLDPQTLRIPPSGGMFLSYVYNSVIDVHFSNYTDKNVSRLFIGGQLRNEFPILESRGKFGLLGVEFNPAGFYYLFERKASLFTDKLINLSEINLKDSTFLTSKLNSKNRIEEYISILEAYLIGQISEQTKAPLVEKALKIIVKYNGHIKINHLAYECGSYPKKLLREFQKIIGVPPKHYAKIIQLNTAFSSINEKNQVKLNEIALDSGYFDQSHFIKDFNRYIGTRPHSFLKSNDQFLKTFMTKRRLQENK